MTDVLGKDTAGIAEERPTVAWKSSDVLEISVPGNHYVKLLTTSVKGVAIKLYGGAEHE